VGAGHLCQIHEQVVFSNRVLPPTSMRRGLVPKFRLRKTSRGSGLDVQEETVDLWYDEPESFLLSQHGSPGVGRKPKFHRLIVSVTPNMSVVGLQRRPLYIVYGNSHE
jgi:hypothetical protein